MNAYLSDPALARSITRVASTQTYHTIKYLADRSRVDDAYRAYAYFRWLDDCLDQGNLLQSERLDLMRRQQALIGACAHRNPPADLAPQECLLADLILRDADRGSGLQAYIRNMTAVMAFDAVRRGKLVSQRELSDYTRWLAVAVTEAMHYFIGHNDASPHGDIRYQAVMGAHITHMLRDALEDVQAGYYNIPSEILLPGNLDPHEVDHPAYRAWAQAGVKQARACFKAGRLYLSQVASLRCRIAGYAYMRRFEIVLDCIEREGFALRAAYPERKTPARAAEMLAWALWMALKVHRGTPVSYPQSVKE